MVMLATLTGSSVFGGQVANAHLIIYPESGRSIVSVLDRFASGFRQMPKIQQLLIPSASGS
jgi:hypothetical protein